jgi:ABC-2 type transport system permease protein
VRLYYEVAKRSFARQGVYRSANFAGLATNSFFGIMRTYLFIALYASAGAAVQAGWTLDDAITFVWVAQALIMPIFIWGWWEIALTIRSGDVVSDLSKPFDYYSFWLAQDAGRAIFHVLFRAIPTLAVGVLLFDARLLDDPLRWLAFLLSGALAIWISFGLRFLSNISTFWFLDYRGVGLLLMFMNSFFAGLLVPLNYWPDWARPIAEALPFAGMIQAPVDVYLGKATGMELLGLFLFQFTWGAGLMLANRLVLGLAVRKVIVQGG